jgi:competence protein ComFC
MHMLIKTIYLNALNIFFPTKCVACGQYGHLLCLDCLKTVDKISTSTCFECGKISKNGEYCQTCKKTNKPALNSILVACGYDSIPIKEIIHQLKYGGLTGLSEICGELIYERVQKVKLPHDFVIIPVPLHKFRIRNRGFNQAELIAKYVSKRIGVHGGDALKRVKNTKNQVGLSRKDRLINVEGVFDCIDVSLIKGQNVLLIDDVVTTGATLNECAKALKSAGAKRVDAAVLARNI